MTDLYKIEKVPILKTGIWSGSKGRTEFNTTDLAELENQFGIMKSENPDYALPLKLGHSQDDSEPAVGWFDNIRLIGNELYADLIDLPESVYKFINLKGFKNRSVEIGKRIDSVTGDVIGKALKGMALLGAKLPAVNLRLAGSGAAGLESLGKALYGVTFSEEDTQTLIFEEAETMEPNEETKVDDTNEQTTDMGCGGDSTKTKKLEESLSEAQEKINKIEQDNIRLSEQIKIFVDLQKKSVKEHDEHYVESLLKENKILPTQKDIVIEMLSHADNDNVITVNFSENEEKTTYKEMITKFFESLKPLGLTSQSSQTEETLSYEEVTEKFSLELYEKPFCEISAEETRNILSTMKRNDRYKNLLPEGL